MQFVESFVFNWGEVSEFGMATLPVVEDPEVLEDLVDQLGPGFHFLRSRNSVCIFDQNDSIIALSYPSPTVPSESISPAALPRLAKVQDVNCTPWPE